MLDWDDIKVGDYVRLSEDMRYWFLRCGCMDKFIKDPLLVVKADEDGNCIHVRKPNGKLLRVKGDSPSPAHEWGSNCFDKIDRFMADVELALISGEGKKRE